MPDFKYTALDRSGKQVTGMLAGRDTQDAAAKVKQLGYFPVEISSGGTGAGAAARQLVSGAGGKARPAFEAGGTRTETPQSTRPTGKKVPRVQILLVTRELADLIDAGLPIDRAMSVLIEQTESEQLREMLRTMQGDIRAGNPLSDALRKFPREFSGLYCNMVHAGEVSGQLAEVMNRLADFMEKEQVRRSQVMAALTYPMVLISVAVLAVIFLLTFVIPKLQDVFKDLGASLPTPTKLLLALSGLITNYWWALILGVAGAVFGFRVWTSTTAGRRTWDTIRIRAPLFGKLVQRMVMARFVRTLGTLIGGGVPILTALEISAGAVGNSVTEAAVVTARDGVRQGETLSHAMENTGSFLPLVTHMTAVGEETGRLPNMLLRTADTLDFEVDNTMRKLTSLVEPLIVLLMGAFVGTVVLSILLPIFEVSTVVK
jgi:type II secretion system protein F